MVKNRYIVLLNYIDTLENKYIKRIDEFNLDTDMNFKRILVRDFMGRKNIEQYVNTYIDKFAKTVRSSVKFQLSGIELTCRIKNKQSVYAKINRFLKEKEDGKISINKCLNDLLGIRFIVDDSEEYDEIILKIKDKYSDSKYKLINSSENGYKAHHLYI